jgi:hypothetical protein
MMVFKTYQLLSKTILETIKYSLAIITGRMQEVPV